MVDTQALRQVLNGGVPLFGGEHVHHQRDDIGRLRFRNDPAAGRDILPAEGFPDLGGQFRIGTGILFLAQQVRGVSGKRGGVGIEGGGDEPGGRKTEKIVGVLGVLGQPVAQVETTVQVRAILVLSGHVVHPGGHAFVLLSQDVQIPIVQVQRPGNQHRGIAPARSGNAPHVGFEQDIGYGHWHETGLFLFAGQVIEVLVVKLLGIHVQAGCGRKYLRVPRPAHAFVPLGAVRGVIHKVGLLSPQGVEEKPVYHGIGATELAGLLHGGIEDLHGEAFGVHRVQTKHPGIAETKEGKGGGVVTGLAVADVNLLGKGGTQVLPVQVAILIQYLARLQADLRARGPLATDADTAAGVLPEVQQSISIGGMQQRGTESPHHLDRQILPCLEQRRVQLCKADALPGFFSCGKRPGTVPQAAVENLAVIDLCPHKGAGGGLPAFVGGNQQGFTIFQLHGELGNQGIFISVDATAFLHTGPADPALVITVAQPGAQYVFS